ncbi:hypothetical protein [Romboutsia sp.]|uniref:hypothetical protein n=1 Tax=Romboutsia sp. TaxID=1965302 RepID=UPI002C3CD067|nr:hypothetical protein [Romboutsia sp.]HSQ89104.1 hypothetical protein [Romboutsia sp.]
MKAKKTILTILLAISGGYVLTYLIGVVFLSGITTQSSSTSIEIKNLNEKEYAKIQQEVKLYVEQTLHWDCHDIEGFNIKVSCKYNEQEGSIFIKDEPSASNKEKLLNVTLGYSESKVSQYPTSAYMTQQHKEIQKHLLNIASDYKKRYKNVKVFFGSPNEQEILEIPNLPYTVLPNLTKTL